jgi:hypothetical protein
MTLIQIGVAGFMFGVAGNFSLWAIQQLNQFLIAVIAFARNRQALELERHKFVCRSSSLYGLR